MRVLFKQDLETCLFNSKMVLYH